MVAPPSTDSNRKLLGRPSASFRNAETGVSTSATSVVQTICGLPPAKVRANSVNSGSARIAVQKSLVN